MGIQDVKDEQVIAIRIKMAITVNHFKELERTSLVENGIDCSEEEFGNDFNASLEGDDSVAGDHFDRADYF